MQIPRSVIPRGLALAAVLLLAAVAGCSPDSRSGSGNPPAAGQAAQPEEGGGASNSATGTPPGGQAETLAIPVMISKTGQAAFLGQEEDEAFRALETWLNKNGGVAGRQVDFLIEDTQTSPQRAVQLMNQFIAEGYPVVLGPEISAACKAVAPVVGSRVVHYCLGPGLTPPAGSYSFSGSVAFSDLVKATFQFFKDKGWHRIAFLSTTDATGTDFEKASQKWLQDPQFADLTGVAFQHYAVTDVSVTAQLTQIKAADPDVLVVWATGPPAATAFRGVVQQGLTLPLATDDGNMTSTQMRQYAELLPQDQQPYIASGGWAAYESLPEGPHRDAVKTFMDALDEIGALGNLGVGHALAWDPARLVLSAFETLGPTASAAQVHDYLEGLKDYYGAMGRYDMTDGSQRGLTEGFIYQWDVAKQSWVGLSGPGGVASSGK